jgi:hypothetical protein
MHQSEGAKFTNGDLNNAMGSDFYQRDRNLKQQNNETTENIGEHISGDEEDDD